MNFGKYRDEKVIVEKRVRFNDQVQFILPTQADEVWEQDDTALMQTWTRSLDAFVDNIEDLVGDVNSFQVSVWFIDQRGQGSHHAKQVVLQKHLKQQWHNAILNIWEQEGVSDRAEVSIVSPTPSVNSESAEIGCIHAIVWHKVKLMTRFQFCLIGCMMGFHSIGQAGCCVPTL